MNPKRRIAAVCTVAAMAAASCGVPTGPESFEAIDGAEVPNRLNETTSTTTTTTTTTTTMLPTTQPDQAATTTTTTEPEPPTEFVDIYFLSRGELRPQATEVLAAVTANDLIFLLEAGPASDLLDTEIRSRLIETTSEDDGILTIELNDLVFQRIPERDQREAIAQMVLTFLNNLTGIGQAVFTIDDERLIVPVGNGQSTEDPVSLDDYENMLVNADPETTTTTVAPTTAAPPTEAPATVP
jgi:hypothetical protein